MPRKILKQLPPKGIVMLTHLFNVAFRAESWKVAEVVTIPKPGKPPHEVQSYRLISLLPVISKVFEKLILKRLKPMIQNAKLIADHQFGFRQKHSITDRITNVPNRKNLEGKQICSAHSLMSHRPSTRCGMKD
jgi:hypothetical protein